MANSQADSPSDVAEGTNPIANLAVRRAFATGSNTSSNCPSELHNVQGAHKIHINHATQVSKFSVFPIVFRWRRQVVRFNVEAHPLRAPPTEVILYVRRWWWYVRSAQYILAINQDINTGWLKTLGSTAWICVPYYFIV